MAERVGKWYFGGIAGAAAASCTHPLDLLKVHLQTQEVKEFGLIGMGKKVVKVSGFFALYNGLSASLMRQLTYSTTRFAIYETCKKGLVDEQGTFPFHQKVLLGAVAGCCGGFVGTPADLINVRMQNDVKLVPELRKNYGHVFDGFYQVCKREGPVQLFSGTSMACSRAVFVTIGQLSMYDQFKQILLEFEIFSDNIYTHFLASLMAGSVATAITMPLDVMKTRMMNSKPGEYTSLLHCARHIAITGPFSFFKGFLPAFFRLGPHTVLTFIFFEQLRQRFGTINA